MFVPHSSSGSSRSAVDSNLQPVYLVPRLCKPSYLRPGFPAAAAAAASAPRPRLSVGSQRLRLLRRKTLRRSCYWYQDHVFGGSWSSCYCNDPVIRPCAQPLYKLLAHIDRFYQSALQRCASTAMRDEESAYGSLFQAKDGPRTTSASGPSARCMASGQRRARSKAWAFWMGRLIQSYSCRTTVIRHNTISAAKALSWQRL